MACVSRFRMVKSGHLIKVMNRKLSIIGVLLSLIFPFGTAFAGGGSDFDAQIIRVAGEKVIFGEESGVLRYINFCGTFAGDLYYGNVLVVTDPALLVLQENLPLYANIHFTGGISGGTALAGGGYNYCLSDGSEAKVKVETQEYTVMHGDTLGSILRTQGGSARDARLVARLNGLANPRFITAGQILIIPVY